LNNIPTTDSLEFFDLETWGQRLLQLLGLFLVSDNEGVQVSGAAHFELGVFCVFLDLHRLGVLPPGLQQEVFDFHDLFRHVDD